MAQINPTVGDLSGNSRKILAYVERAKKKAADLVVFPELALTGYPPEDLLLKPGFVDDNMRCLKGLGRRVHGITVVVGFVDRSDDIYNAAAVIHSGRVVDVYHKMYLPNYGVFDERRYFQAGKTPLVFMLHGVKVGVGICEDIWYPDGPARTQALYGAELIVNINASPYHIGKDRIREEMLTTRALDNGVIIAYNNMVGGQDELVFDGRGIIIDEAGDVVAKGRPFVEDLVIADLDIDAAFMARLHGPSGRGAAAAKTTGPRDVREVTLRGRKLKTRRPALKKRRFEELSRNEDVYSALVLGTKDYVRKNGFKHVVVGLSGGIDSSLVAAVAADALGPSNITGVFMPSRYTSKASKKDAENLAENLGIRLKTIPINDAFSEYLKTLRPVFKGRKADTTEENLQARIRGNILMALSNKFGWLVLTTGNKSEMSVGYATLYGDMAGGFAVIKDVPKMMVYEIAAWINERAGCVIIPKNVFTKAPSAELKPGQTDQDSLPPYGLLDEILKAYIEDDKSLDEIAAVGFPRRVVKKIIKMVDLSEYKRRQAPPGVKITPRAFGRDRRMPITNGYRNGYKD